MAEKKELTQEQLEKRRENHRQYAKRTNYASQTKSNAKNTRLFNLRASISTESDIIKKMESVDSISGYLKALIREDIKKNGI